MRMLLLVLGLALAGCADLASTHTALKVGAQEVQLPPRAEGQQARVIVIPPIDYWSNKEQDWSFIVDPETGKIEARIRAPNSPGMTGEQMAAVIGATAQGVGNAVSTALGAMSVAGALPVVPRAKPPVAVKPAPAPSTPSTELPDLEPLAAPEPSATDPHPGWLIGTTGTRRLPIEIGEERVTYQTPSGRRYTVRRVTWDAWVGAV